MIHIYKAMIPPFSSLEDVWIAKQISEWIKKKEKEKRHDVKVSK